jgi:hypothetical protein
MLSYAALTLLALKGHMARMETKRQIELNFKEAQGNLTVDS